MHALFADHFILGVQSASGMNAEKNGTVRTLNKEVLITNYSPPKSLFIKQKEVMLLHPTLELEATASYSTNSPAIPGDFVLLNSPLQGASPAKLLK